MSFHHWRFPLLLLCLVQGSMIYGQEPVKKKILSPDNKQITFSDEFQSDNSSQYVLQGSVKWEKGKIILEEGGRIRKDVNAGAKSKLTLHLNSPELVHDGQKTETWIRFNVTGAGSIAVVIRHQRTDGKTTSDIFIVHTYYVNQPGKAKRQLKTFLKRRLTGLKKLRSSVLTVTYCHGLVTVAADNSEIAWGYIARHISQPVESWSLQSHTGKLICHQFNINSTSKPPAYTHQQQQLLQEARKINLDFVRLYRLGKFQQALDLARQSADITSKVAGDAHPIYATDLNNVALTHKSMKDYAKANLLYIHVQDIQKKELGNNHPEYADTLNNQATLYRAMGNYSQAESLFIQSRDIRKKVLGEEHPSYAQSLNNLAFLYHFTKEYTKAIPLYVQALKIREKALGREHADYLQTLENLAVLYRDTQDYIKAEPLFIQVRDIREKMLGEEHPKNVQNLIKLAGLYLRTGEYTKAEPLFIQVRNIKKKVLGEEDPQYAVSLNDLAILYKSMGEYTKAELLYIQAKDVTKKALGETHPDYALSLNNLAMLHASMGDYAKAEPLFIQARDIRKKAMGNNNSGSASILNNLATLYYTMGDFARAEPLYIQARDIWKKRQGESQPDYATSLNNLAQLYKSNGDYAKAKLLCIQAMDIREKSLGASHPDYAQSLSNLARLYKSMGDYAKAKPLLIQALSIRKMALGESHPDYAANLNNLALLYEAVGDHAKAKPLFQQAFVIYEESAVKLVPTLSEAQAISWMAEHKPRLDFILSNARHHDLKGSSDLYQWVWRARSLSSRLQANRRQPENANEDVIQLYRQLLQTRQQLAQLTLAIPNPKQIDTRRKRLEKLNAEKEDFERSLASLSTGFKQQLKLQKVKPEDLAKLLSKKMAVVDITHQSSWKRVIDKNGKTRLIPEKHYDAFVLVPANNPKGYTVKWVPLGLAEPINNVLTQWRTTLQSSNLHAHKNTRLSRDVLRTLIWQKIEPHLQGRKQVVIFADGDLHFLPWAALPGKKTDSYLIEEYAISTAQSGPQLYGALTDKYLQQGGLILVGGIDYDKRDADESQPITQLASSKFNGSTRSPVGKKIGVVWPSLSGSLEEIKAIQGLWNGNLEPRLLQGKKADENQLRNDMPSNRYIHLATHGFFANEKYRSMFGHNPQNEQLFGGVNSLATAELASATMRNPLILSGIVLAGANLPQKTDTYGLPIGQDGIFTAEEVINLDLRNAELVVVSACETGLGRVSGGEGVFGLQRAFRQAGARTVIASLWKVDDVATRTLMVEFYRNIWEKKMGKTNALRQAQLTMIRRYRVKPGRLRAPGKSKLIPKIESGKNTQQEGPLPPFYWAAFVLNGDWR